MTNAEHIIALNTALVQLCDAKAKIDAALSNARAVMADLSITHPALGTMAAALDRVKMSMVQLDELCERFPR